MVDGLSSIVRSQVTKKPPVVRAALCVYLECYFTLTFAILTTNRSLIIRTAIRMTIRERLKIEFIRLQVFRPIIGLIGNPSMELCQNVTRQSWTISRQYSM